MVACMCLIVLCSSCEKIYSSFSCLQVAWYKDLPYFCLKIVIEVAICIVSAAKSAKQSAADAKKAEESKVQMRLKEKEAEEAAENAGWFDEWRNHSRVRTTMKWVECSPGI